MEKQFATMTSIDFFGSELFESADDAEQALSDYIIQDYFDTVEEADEETFYVVEIKKVVKAKRTIETE